MASQFGGIPVSDNPTSRFGGTPIPLDQYYAQKAGTDPATLKSYARQWYGGDIQKASVAYAKASQGGQEPGIGDTLKQGLENAKAFGQGVVDLGKGAWQQAKDIINPPPAAEAKYNAQHALDSVDPDVLLNWIKDKYDKGGLSPQDQKDLFRGMGTLGAQALVAKAADTAVQKPEAVSSAVDTAKTGLANAADVTGTVVKGAAQGIAEGHKGAAKLAVPMVATIASSIPEVGHYVGPAIEGLYDAHNAVKGIKGALAERAAAKLKAALDAAQEAAIEAHRAANPPQPYDPSYSSAPAVAGPVEAIPATATPTGRAPGKFSEAEPLPPRAPLNPNLQATPPAPQPPVEPIASDLPSGKRVPTAEERVARASTEIAQPSPPATPDTALLDSVAKGQTGKLFKNLTGPQQEIVKKLATQVAEPSASPAPPASLAPATQTTPKTAAPLRTDFKAQPGAMESLIEETGSRQLAGIKNGTPGVSFEPYAGVKDSGTMVYRDASGKPVGFLEFTKGQGTSVVYTDPAFRRGGVATALRDAASKIEPKVLTESGKNSTPSGASFANGANAKINAAAALKSESVPPITTPAETIAAKKTGSETPSAQPTEPPPGTVMVKPSQVQGAGENAPAFDGKWDAEDLARINNYRQMIEKGQPFREDPTDPNSPVAPIRLYKQPDGSLTTQDGFHRLAAAQQAGDAPLPAQIEDVKPPAAKAQTPAEIIAEKKAGQSRATETTPAETLAAKKGAPMAGEDNRSQGAVSDYRAGQTEEGYGQTRQENANRNGNAQRAWDILKKEGYKASDLVGEKNRADVLDFLKDHGAAISRRKIKPEAYVPSEDTLDAIHALAQAEESKAPAETVKTRP